MADLAPGSEFAGYRILDAIGRGGMGAVYRATQISLERTVALKIIVPELAQDEGFRERFKRESRTAASIEHPHVVPVHEAGEHDGVLFISMRYIEGTDLRQLLRSEGAMAPERAARIIAQVGSALDAAHARGLVHRDVKPANILMAADGGEDHAYLTDFGLTKHVASAAGLTGTGQFVGTLDYIAPEQIQGGTVDARADIYALGCVMYELLSGKTPFARENDVAKLWAHMNDAPPSIDVDPRLEEVVHRAMAKRPEDRQPSAGDVGRAALAAAEGHSVPQAERSVAAGAAAPVTDPRPDPQTIGGAPGATFPGHSGGATAPQAPPPSPTPSPRRRTGLIAAGAAGLVLVGVALALLLGGGDDENEPATSEAAAAAPSSGGGKRLPRGLALQVMAQYADYFEDENLIGLEESFTDDFTYDPKGDFCVGDTTEADLDRALNEYQCQFEKLTLPAMKLGPKRVFVGKGRAEARAPYLITDDGKPVERGRLKLVMVPDGDWAKIARVEVEKL